MGARAPGLCTRLNPTADGLLVRRQAAGDLVDGKPLPTKVARLDYAAVIDLHATSVHKRERGGVAGIQVLTFP